MFSSKSSIQYFVVFVLLSVYSVDQATAIRCYACNSDNQPDCISNAAQSKFMVECSTYVNSLNNSMLVGFNKYDDMKTKAIVEYDCAFARGISTKDSRTIVERGCGIKPVTCDTYKIIYAVGDGKGNGFQVDNCKRCDTDLCNTFYN